MGQQGPQVKLEEGLRHERASSAVVGVGGMILDQPAMVAPPYSSPVVTGQPSSELDISLSSTADLNGDDLGFMDQLLPIDLARFDHLSPTLQNEDFNFSMDNSTEGIDNLFDIV